ncbi:MAG: DNA polymerase Y family protein [Pseudomonadota bacterium]
MTAPHPKPPARRILHLWLCRFATDRLAIREGEGLRAMPCVTVSKVKGALIVEALNAVAAGEGLEPGMTLSETRAQVPHVEVAAADPQGDDKALHKIARALERYTPFVGLDAPDGLMLDISGCAHLFGGEEAMMDDVIARLAGWGYESACAICDNPALSSAVARFGGGGIVREGEALPAIAQLPVAALRLPEEIATVLNRLGLKTVEQLYAQPRTPLMRRFGVALARRMDQALGLESEPITPLSPVEPFVAERRFAEPLMSMDAIGACVTGLAEALGRSMGVKGEGARRLVLRLFHADGAVREARVGTAEPLIDAEHMAALLMPRIEALSARIEDESGIDLLRLSAAETGPRQVEQVDFCRERDAMASLSGLIDTLSARFGPSSVQRFVPADTHQPIEADRRMEAQTLAGDAAWPDHNESERAWALHADTAPTPRRPLRLFHPPEPVEALASVPEGPPVRFVWRRAFYHVVAAEGPERISANWWASEAAHTCDYFAVEDTKGRRFWLFRQGLYGRETNEARWFMHGMFA